MTAIHKGLEKASFVKPSGLVEQTICKNSGCIATTGCSDTYKEIFTSDNLPGKCEGHGLQTICSETGMLATEFCSQYVPVESKGFGGVVPKEKLQLWKTIGGTNASTAGKINETCNVHTKPKEEEKPKPPVTNNTTNNTNNTAGNTNNTNTNTNTNTNNNVAGNTNTPSNTTNTTENKTPKP